MKRMAGRGWQEEDRRKRMAGRGQEQEDGRKRTRGRGQEESSSSSYTLLPLSTYITRIQNKEVKLE